MGADAERLALCRSMAEGARAGMRLQPTGPGARDYEAGNALADTEPAYAKMPRKVAREKAVMDHLLVAAAVVANKEGVAVFSDVPPGLWSRLVTDTRSKGSAELRDSAKAVAATQMLAQHNKHQHEGQTYQETSLDVLTEPTEDPTSAEVVDRAAAVEANAAQWSGSDPDPRSHPTPPFATAVHERLLVTKLVDKVDFTDQEYTALLLHTYEGQPHKDIAARMGLDLETAKTYHKRATNKLRKAATAHGLAPALYVLDGYPAMFGDDYPPILEEVP